MELERLKADNERLILLLRTTNDYQEMTDADILKKAMHLSSSGSLGATKRGKSSDPLSSVGKSTGHSSASGGPNL